MNFTNTTFFQTEEINSSNVNSVISFQNNHFKPDLTDRFHLFLKQPPQILALCLSIIAIILNLLSIAALSRVPNRMTSHFLFIISLAASDILIGVSVLSYQLNKILQTSYRPGYGPWNERLQYRCAFMLIKATNSIALNISLLNLMGMALDHFVAIMKPLHYFNIMTKKRSSIIICVLWLLAIFLGLSDFMTGFKLYPKYSRRFNYCELVWLTPFQEEYITFCLAFVCFVSMMVIYVRIFILIMKRRSPGESGQNLTPKKKAVTTTLMILGSFVICWLPACIFQLTMITIIKINPGLMNDLVPKLKTVDQYLFALLLINSIADPLIYAVRNQEVKIGYRRLFCGWKNRINTRRGSNGYLYSSTAKTRTTVKENSNSNHKSRSVNESASNGHAVESIV